MNIRPIIRNHATALVLIYALVAIAAAWSSIHAGIPDKGDEAFVETTSSLGGDCSEPDHDDTACADQHQHCHHGGCGTGGVHQDPSTRVGMYYGYRSTPAPSPAQPRDDPPPKSFQSQ